MFGLNGRDFETFFGSKVLRMIVRQPLLLTETDDKFDIYMTIALGAVNTTVFTKFMGPLSATGTATASINVQANLGIPKGFKLYHAYIVYDGITGQVFTSSNPVSVEFK